LHAGITHTVAFVRDCLSTGATILDVGCGDGRVALALRDAGYIVTAIDGNENAIAEARANGLDAQLVVFAEYKADKKFGAILFGRSLHHMPLDESLEKAKSLVTTGGVIILDEFGAELFDERCASWYYGLKSFLLAAGKEAGRGPKLPDGAIPDDPVAHWREHHFGKHAISTSVEVIDAVKRQCTIEREQRVPYIYRYFLDDVSEEQGRRLFEWETHMVQQNLLPQIGFQIVCKPH
jgi:SAM-dependent methyltransferase